MSMIALGPCPFCGRVPWSSSFDTRVTHERAVVCECGARGPTVEVEYHGRTGCYDHDATERRAREVWNQRVSLMRFEVGACGLKPLSVVDDRVCPSCQAGPKRILDDIVDGRASRCCSSCGHRWPA